jgi:hypothetical protein
MVAVLDACTVINLMLIYNDDRYIQYVEKTFKEIIISHKVFDEICANKFDNLIDRDVKKQLDAIIYNSLSRYVLNKNPESVCKFVEQKNPYEKKDGEFFSVSHSLSSSRLGQTELRQNILNVHFITDDEPATDEFRHFYRINTIGQIINTIDLMTVFCLKGHIGKGELYKFCSTLKLLYNRNAALIIQEIKRIKDAKQFTPKEELTLTSLLEVVTELADNAIETVQNIMNSRILTNVFRENILLKNMINEFIISQSRRKISTINQRILDFKKVWELDYT